ncbi:CAP domain-containing protein [Loktanella sp. DJP18]|uniref:CAP domain-containing protein n=1 Tax=Loktanella sp. DJP18 TaxID=3409788 RepID=UPI003BB4F9F0
MFRIFLTALLLTLTAQAAAAANACAMPGNVNQMASEIAAGVNAQRRAHGLAPLAYNATLGRAAMTQACDMSVNNFFGHRGSNGSNVSARVQAAGYRNCTIAENLAWGYPTSGQIIGGWMNSSGHRANMLHPRVAEMGVGITTGSKGPNWVLVLGRRC